MGILPEARLELGAAEVRRIRDFDHRAAELQARARGEVRHAEIQVCKDLIAGEGLTVTAPRDYRDGARVHDRELHVRARAIVRRAAAAAPEPIVTHQPRLRIQRGGRNNLPFAGSRTPDDHFHGAVVCRRSFEHGQCRPQIRHGHVQPLIAPAKLKLVCRRH